jgi:hypothetical protein
MAALVLDSPPNSDVGRMSYEYHYVFRVMNKDEGRIVRRIAWEWHSLRYEAKIDVYAREKDDSIRQLQFLFAVR